MDPKSFGALFGGLFDKMPADLAAGKVISMTVSQEKSTLQVGLQFAAIVEKGRHL